jgi:hypothetical protein
MGSQDFDPKKVKEIPSLLEAPPDVPSTEAALESESLENET